MKNVIDGISNILSYINPFSDNFFGKKIIELLKDALSFLFIPSEERVNGLVDSVKCKFSFIDSVKSSITDVQSVLSGAQEAPSLTVHIKSTKYTEEQDVKIIDLSWYAPYKNYGDMILTGFIYAMFFWRIFTHLPNIISGAGGAYNDVPAMLDDLVAYNRFGFGRSSSTIRHQDNKNGGTYRK